MWLLRSLNIRRVHKDLTKVELCLKLCCKPSSISLLWCIYIWMSFYANIYGKKTAHNNTNFCCGKKCRSAHAVRAKDLASPRSWWWLQKQLKSVSLLGQTSRWSCQQWLLRDEGIVMPGTFQNAWFKHRFLPDNAVLRRYRLTGKISQ